LILVNFDDHDNADITVARKISIGRLAEPDKRPYTARLLLLGSIKNPYFNGPVSDYRWREDQ
jgi:hypothetical protein